MDEWNAESQLLKGGQKYDEFVQREHISLTNTQLILELYFAIPVTSAARETVFSITNALWTDQKSRFLVETIKAVLVTKTHFEELPCNDFCTLISNNTKLLQEIRSSMKYKISAFNINWKLTSKKIL
jgi:hypothetical protein